MPGPDNIVRMAPRAPVIIGVAGGSGSGKTTVVRRIVDALGDEQVSVIDHDRYYHDHPNLRLEDRASLLRAGLLHFGGVPSAGDHAQALLRSPGSGFIRK